MKIIYIPIYIFVTLLLSACSSPSPDKQASAILAKARQHFTEGRYDAARDSILSMRSQYPTAIQTRAQGILLLDSIEMLAAKDSMAYASGEEWKRLSIKTQFFERKLQEDKIKLQK